MIRAALKADTEGEYIGGGVAYHAFALAGRRSGRPCRVTRSHAVAGTLRDARHHTADLCDSAGTAEVASAVLHTVESQGQIT